MLQVGSFVWTHLTNLMESSDPANKYVKQILNDDILAKEFDLDKRKFSRNYEGSFFIDSLNTGAKVCDMSYASIEQHSFEPHHKKNCFLHVCENNKGADQLCSNRTADQHLCFHYIDSTISLHVLPLSEISSL